MATALSELKTLSGGDPGKKKKPTMPTISDEQLDRFSTLGDSPNIPDKAKYLSQMGLIGADQLLTDHPDLSTPKGIINAQSHWKTAATELMLRRARKAGLKTPAEIKANRAALLAALPPRLSEAIQHPVFNQIHKNYWDVFDSILKDRYGKESATPPISSLATSLAKK